MKLISILLLCGSIFNSNIIAQQDPEVIPQQILDLENILENSATKSEMQNSVQNMNDNDIKRVANIFFNAFEKDAVLTYQYFRKRDDEIKLANKMDITEGVMPNETKWELIKRFKNHFGSDIYTLIWIPYLLKVKINHIEKYTYIDPKSPAKLSRTDIDATILDIVKGSSRFNVGDIVNFYFMDYWRPTLDNFVEGETCFIPLAPNTEYNNDYKLIALVTTLDAQNNDIVTLNNYASFGRYPIDEGNLFDKNNFWGYGEKISWTEFKANLNKNINLIKSW